MKPKNGSFSCPKITANNEKLAINFRSNDFPVKETRLRNQKKKTPLTAGNSIPERNTPDVRRSRRYILSSKTKRKIVTTINNIVFKAKHGKTGSNKSEILQKRVKSGPKKDGPLR